MVRQFRLWIQGTAAVLEASLIALLLAMTLLPSPPINARNAFLLPYAPLPGLTRTLHRPPDEVNLAPRLWITAEGEPRFFYTLRGGSDARLLYDGLTGQPLGQMPATSEADTSVYVYDVSQDGRWAVYWNGSSRGSPTPVQLRDLVGGTTYPFPVAVSGHGHNPAFSPAGPLLAFTYDAVQPFLSTDAALWSPQEGAFMTLPRTARHGEELVSNVAFSPDGRYLLYISLTSARPRIYTYYLWDVQRAAVVAESTTGYSTSRVELSPTGDFALLYSGPVMALRSLGQHTQLAWILYDGDTIAASFSPDGRRLAALDDAGEVRFWGVE